MEDASWSPAARAQGPRSESSCRWRTPSTRMRDNDGAVNVKANLLIVDDDANTLASLARAFRLAGHEATVCDNPQRALELSKAEPFDLIFSDVVMPGKDG